MSKRLGVVLLFLMASHWIGPGFVSFAQQTLGGITGQVVDSSGGALSATTVNLVGDQTQLTRTVTADGSPVRQIVAITLH